MSNSIRVDKLHRIHTRAILDYLGVPISKQSNKVNENRDMLSLYQKTHEEEFAKAYELIVQHKLPIPKDKTEAEINELKMKFGSILTEHATSIEKNSSEKLENLLSNHLVNFIRDTKKDASIAIEEAAKRFERIEVKVGNKKPKPINGVMPKTFPRLLDLASARKNILMVGPSGCGKTFIAGKIAEALDLDFASQSCSEGMSESALTGWLLPIGDAGKFEYVSSEFVRIYENGGLFLFDEIDSSDPNVMVYLNQALANDGFYLPQRHTKPYVKKHKDFVGIAAANTYGNGADAMYVGRNQLDAATLDRFRVGMVEMEYDSDVEKSIICEEVYEWGTNIRLEIHLHRLRKIMSTRVMEDASDMFLNFGWSLKDIEKGYFEDWSKEELSMINMPF